MVNKYEEPGQRLHSHNWSDEYKENYEKIFGKKETWLERREREQKAEAAFAEAEAYRNKLLDSIVGNTEDK